MFEKEAEERARKLEESQTLGVYDNDEDYARDSGWNDGEVAGYEEGFIDGAEFGYNKAKEEMQEQGLALQSDMDKTIEQNIALKKQIEKMKWHKLDWDKAEENPDVDKLVRVKTRSGAEYICETYSYFPAEDEIGYGSVITQFAELNGDWVDDNEIEYWCYIEPFKEIKENDL